MADVEYVERPLPQLKCPLCGMVAVQPLVTSACQHVFCAHCVEVHRKQRACPVDGSLFQASLCEAPVDMVALLDALEVRCLSMPHGCSWTGPRSHVLTHLQTDCEFPLIMCPACQTKVSCRAAPPPPPLLPCLCVSVCVVVARALISQLRSLRGCTMSKNAR
jgi:hypothetical protein